MKNVNAEKLITTRGLPKTGQSIVYETGDDGTYQAGWWLKQLLSDNKTRFVAKTIGGDEVFIDLATGLMWPTDKDGAGCNSGDRLRWPQAVSEGLALTFAGFSNWRLPNLIELLSLLDYSLYVPAFDENLFSAYTNGDEYPTSTTYKGDTNYAWAVYFRNGVSGFVSKGETCYVRWVRNI